MKIGIGLLLAICLTISTVMASEPVTRTVYVPAWPLQVYNAFTTDWQLKLWTGAQGVYTDSRAGGAWRVKYENSVNQGLYDSTSRPDHIALSVLLDSTMTHAVLDFKRTGDSTEIGIRHFIPDSLPQLRDQADAYWNAQLPLLTHYLTALPGGYYAVPNGNGPFPAVVIVHDRFGMNRTVRSRCDSVASRGFLAIAPDMFRGDVTGDLAQANRFLQAVNESEAVSAARRAMSFLKNRSDVDQNHVALWGLGYGDKITLTLAAEEPRLKGGILWRDPIAPGPELLNRITCPVVAIFGDFNVDQPRADIKDFNQAMTQAGIRVDVKILPAIKDFGDPAYGEGYSQPATSQALQITFDFLDKQLRL
jgi:carboxymethylenebutenolidase